MDASSSTTQKISKLLLFIFCTSSLFSSEKFKFMLLQVCIKEESFKDFLDIKNKFNTKYFESIK